MKEVVTNFWDVPNFKASAVRWEYSSSSVLSMMPLLCLKVDPG